jgi:aspartate dehydrogenase
MAATRTEDAPPPRSPRRVGVVGCGRIALPVALALAAGEVAGWSLGGVLARSRRTIGPLQVTDDAEAFLAADLDLIVEAAGATALAGLAESALQVADVWTVNGTALADRRLVARVEAACRRSGRRLRLVPGAIAGIDGIALAATDPDAVLHVEVDMPAAADAAEPGPAYTGPVREAAARFPHRVNVAVAAAWAGPGLDRTTVAVRHAADAHRLAIEASSRYGRVQAALEPAADPCWHPVAASLLACLRREALAIWAG